MENILINSEKHFKQIPLTAIICLFYKPSQKIISAL